jgi:S1-C subfamily serine protease
MAVFGPRRRVLVIPATTIERVAAKLESHGRIPRGYLGVGLHPVTVEGSEESGAMIMTIDPKGPANAAGVLQGDIIVTWNGEPVRYIRSLLRTLGPDSVGQEVALGLKRGGSLREIRLTIAERPVA